MKGMGSAIAAWSASFSTIASEARKLRWSAIAARAALLSDKADL